jgi:hypothetical protein
MLAGDRCDPGCSGELGVAREPVRSGDLADEFGGGQRAAARLGDQLRRELADQLGDLALERLDGGGEFAHASQLVAGDADAHRLLGARQAPSETSRVRRRPG